MRNILITASFILLLSRQSIKFLFELPLAKALRSSCPSTFSTTIFLVLARNSNEKELISEAIRVVAFFIYFNTRFHIKDRKVKRL